MFFRYEQISKELTNETWRRWHLRKTFLVQIKKLLKKESIEWTEDGNGQAILIQVDVIDPKRLSFFRKK